MSSFMSGIGFMCRPAIGRGGVQMRKTTQGASRYSLVAVSILLTALFSIHAPAAEVPRIDPAELKEMLWNPGVAIVDVRAEAATAATRIPGSVIEDPAAYAEWSKKYPTDKTIVLYCS